MNTPALSSYSTSASTFIFVKTLLPSTLTPIDNTNTIKSLGITFNKKFKWTDHVASLVRSLSNRVNIIKCISSNKLNCNNLTILNIIKAPILSRIDFGIPFYGNCTTSTTKPIKDIFHSAIRSAISITLSSSLT